MKVFLPLLLVPALAFAQQGQPPQMDQKMFEQIKQSMLPMIQKSLPAMEDTRACVQATGNSEQLQQCAQKMVEFSRQMMIMAGTPADKIPEPPPEAMQMEWSEEIKGKILADIDQAIVRTRATKGCLESSADNQQMSACMQKLRASQPR